MQPRDLSTLNNDTIKNKTYILDLSRDIKVAYAQKPDEPLTCKLKQKKNSCYIIRGLHPTNICRC